MLILALEASTARSSVALIDDDRSLASASLSRPRRHGEYLTPAIAFCLDHAGVSVDRIAGVAVGIGPGLFTGLRVGIATAQAFAGARQLPTVGVSGLDVLAFRHRTADRVICAVIDARRGERYWALYRPSPGGVQRIGDVELGTVERLTAEIDGLGEPCLVVGDVPVEDREPLGRVAVVAAHGAPDAEDLGLLTHPRFVREETDRPERLRPLYLRHADATLGWEARGRLQGGDA